MKPLHFMSVAAFVVLVLVGSGTWAPAQDVVVTRSAGAPVSEILFQSSDTGKTGGQAWRWKTDAPSDRLDVLQQFRHTTNFTLDKISLFTTGGYVIASGTQAPFTLTINAYASASSTNGAAMIATYAGAMTRNGTGNQWYTFDIPDLDLARNTLYGFVLAFTEPVEGSTVTWQTYNGATAFPDAGLAFLDVGALPNFLTADLRFIAQGQNEKPRGTVVAIR